MKCAVSGKYAPLEFPTMRRPIGGAFDIHRNEIKGKIIDLGSESECHLVEGGVYYTLGRIILKFVDTPALGESESDEEQRKFFNIAKFRNPEPTAVPKPFEPGYLQALEKFSKPLDLTGCYTGSWSFNEELLKSDEYDGARRFAELTLHTKE